MLAISPTPIPHSFVNVIMSMSGTESNVDCKTARIFVYSSTLEQSSKRSGARLKTKSKTGKKLLSYAKPILRKKTTFCSLD